MAADARKRAYEEIVKVAKEGLARYYAEFPDRLGDDRAADALAWSMRGVGRIIGVLDRYDIRDRTSKADAPAAAS
ncbi:MAG: hypothetical protein H0U52_17400 [Chloroflexi bacterium]|nr:hypothetical protein [Chloroflexota bacterium]